MYISVYTRNDLIRLQWKVKHLTIEVQQWSVQQLCCRYAGLDSHLVLRNSRTLVDKDPGLVGNLLVERLVGAHIHQVTKEEYVRHGSTHLGNLVVKELQDKGKNHLLIPVGGSNATGTWGYLQFMQELQQQTSAQPFTDIVMVSFCLEAEQRPDFSSMTGSSQSCGSRPKLSSALYRRICKASQTACLFGMPGFRWRAKKLHMPED